MIRSTALALAAFVAIGASGAGVQAEAPRLPETGQAQGITVPHALPGTAPGVHTDAPQHLTAPTGAVPQASARGVEPANALPGRSAAAEVPHADVTSPQGLVPVGSEQGPQTGLPRS